MLSRVVLRRARVAAARRTRIGATSLTAAAARAVGVRFASAAAGGGARKAGAAGAADAKGDGLNKFSRAVTDTSTMAAGQAMLYGAGFSEADMSRAQVQIASMWWSGNPCNSHLRELGDAVADGVRRAGLVAMQINTVGISDAISMGTKGMSYSLPSRDLIADSIEMSMAGMWYDANISVPGCDKNMPGAVMAMARLNRPALMVYGGSILPGCTSKGQTIDVATTMESFGMLVAGKISRDERNDWIRTACPGPGGCGGMYTANTMSTSIEALGMSLPYSSSIPAVSHLKKAECVAAGKAIRHLLERDIKPRDIITRASLENAFKLVCALGGSTNAVLHYLAIARAADVPWDLRDFQRISDATPYIGNLRPSGKYLMHDLHQIGGTPAVIKYLLDNGVLNPDPMTVTGKTIGDNHRHVPGLAIPRSPLAGDTRAVRVEPGIGPGNQDCIMPLDKPIKASGHIQILRGNVAPDGAVAKLTGKEGLTFTGAARVFDCEEDMIAAVRRGELQKGVKTVVVIRYEGPKGGPGMPEMLVPTSAIIGAGLEHDCALITDGRFSGGSHGFIVGHITPEAAVGGPIALLRDGDVVTISVGSGAQGEAGQINVDVPAHVLAERKKQWTAPAPKYTRGVLAKYVRSVQSASVGCVTDEL